MICIVKQNDSEEHDDTFCKGQNGEDHDLDRQIHPCRRTPIRYLHR